jgi:hypothetical protein
MTQKEIENMQRRVNLWLAETDQPLLEVDGFWGPKSQAASRRYLRSLMPVPNPWPSSDQRSVQAFYGKPGDESQLVSIEFPFPMFYGGKRVTRTRCHRKVAASLLRILERLGDRFSRNREVMEEAEDYGGIFNFRPKRGSSSLSLHSWGIAIDLDADDNTFRNTWPLQADMPLEICEEFAREGWTSAGVFWGYDAMHHEATSPD